jgi:hypothetical protein
VALLDPSSQPTPEREERLRANTTRLEIRPAVRAAHLATRSLACPGCGMPIVLAAPVGFDEPVACVYCEGIAPTRDYLRDHGWPEVDLIARLG